MKTLRLYKFEPLGELDPEPVTIIIDEKLPNNETCDGARELYATEALCLEDALYRSLPQGTYDKLAILLMSRKVSLYRGQTE